MRVDTIVIGAGQAGVPLAERLARAGQRVLLAERSRAGGTCVNYGCTPTKTLVASARAAHVARTAGRLGVEVERVRVDFRAVMARKEAIVAQWRAGVERRLAGAGERLTFAHGHARFTGDHELEVAGERHQADAVVIDVGVRPALPRLQGIDGVPWLDNRRVMELAELPSHLVVLGGGYIGCEFAQMFRRFGARVTVVDHNPHLLAREDEDVSAEVEAAFRAEGIELVLGGDPARVEGGPGAVALTLADDRRISGTHLLVAAGRRPNTDDLGCEAGGIALDARGFIRVDDAFRTTAPGVYAVGDVTGGPQFTHTSWDDHRLVFEVLMGRSARPRSGRIVPYTVFVDPPVAGVGLTEREAKARGVAYELAAMPFGQVARAIEIDETAGRMKLLVDPASERILGACIVGVEAGELIHVFAALMQAGAPARHLVDLECVHPTFAEGLQSLVMKLPRYALS
jgi:pyruvate/2-oxoglutarate dehydrogenase complex dihydrolipoamide dehydrogenase (E3) component